MISSEKTGISSPSPLLWYIHIIWKDWYLLSVTTTLIFRRPLKGLHCYFSTDGAWISIRHMKWARHLPPVCRLDAVVTLDSVVVIWHRRVSIKYIPCNVLQYKLLLCQNVSQYQTLFHLSWKIRRRDRCDILAVLLSFKKDLWCIRSIFFYKRYLKSNLCWEIKKDPELHLMFIIVC